MSMLSESERLAASVRAVVGDATARAAFIAQHAKQLKELQRRNVQSYDSALSVLLACLESFDVVQGNQDDALCALTVLSILLSLNLSALQLLQYNSYLNLCLNAVSTLPVAVAAARTFGETLRHSMTTESVRTQTDAALDWLVPPRTQQQQQQQLQQQQTTTTVQQQQQQQARRVCGVLVLTEVVLRAPMLILLKLADMFDRLWGTLASADIEVRSRGLRLFSLCTKVLGDRPPAARLDVYEEQLYTQLRSHLTSSNVEQRIAGLLAFEPIASNSAAYATADMRERLAALLQPFLDASALDDEDDAASGDGYGRSTARGDAGARPSSPRFANLLTLPHHHNSNNNNNTARRGTAATTTTVPRVRRISTATMLQLVYADRPLLFHALVVLCRYDVVLFVQHYLGAVVQLALTAIRRNVQRAAAFDMLGELLQLVGAEAFAPHAAAASAAACDVFATATTASPVTQATPTTRTSPQRMGVAAAAAAAAAATAQQQQQSPSLPCWEALRLYALLFSLCPLPDMEANMDACLERVFRWGISAQLIESMRVIIAASSDAYRGRLAELLLDLISLTLCGLPFRQQQQQQQQQHDDAMSSKSDRDVLAARRLAVLAPSPGGYSSSSSSNGGGGAQTGGVSEHDATVALSALLEFGCLNTELMGDFLRDAVLPFIDSTSATVRNAATTTIVHLLLPPGPKEGLSVSRRMCVHAVLARMLRVALTDANADVRETLLTSFTADFRAYLCEPPFLQQLCNALGDEAIRCRVAALEQLCALVPYDHSHILPVLREQVLTALRLIESAFNTDTVCNGLQLLTAIAERAPTFIVSFVAGVWQALWPYFAAMYPASPLLLPFLQCCVAVASAVQSFAPGSVDFGAHVSTVCNLLDAMPVERGTHAARLACLSFLAATLRPLMSRSSNSNNNSGGGAAVAVVESPYKLHPRLFRQLAGIVRRSDDNEDVRLEALRCLGTVGALDPYLFAAFFAEDGDVAISGAAVAMARVTQTACSAAVLRAIVDLLLLTPDGASSSGLLSPPTRSSSSGGGGGGGAAGGNTTGYGGASSLTAAGGGGGWSDSMLAPLPVSQHLLPQTRSSAQRDVLVRHALQTILTIADLCPSSRGELKHIVSPLARVLAECASNSSNNGNNNNNNNSSNNNNNVAAGGGGGSSSYRAMAVMLYDFVGLMRLVGADALTATASNAADLLGLFLRVWEHCIECRFLVVRLLCVLTHAEASAATAVDLRALKRHMPIVPLLLDTLRARTSCISSSSNNNNNSMVAAAAAAATTVVIVDGVAAAPLELQYAVLSYIVQHTSTLQGYCEQVVMGLLGLIENNNSDSNATPSELVDAAVVTLRVVCASLSVDEYVGAIVRTLCAHLVATVVASTNVAAAAAAAAAATNGNANTTTTAAGGKGERRLRRSTSAAVFGAVAATTAAASPTSSMQAAFLSSLSPSSSASPAGATAAATGGGALSTSVLCGNNNGSQWPSSIVACGGGGSGSGGHARTLSNGASAAPTSSSSAAAAAATASMMMMPGNLTATGLGGGNNNNNNSNNNNSSSSRHERSKAHVGAGVVRGDVFVQHILSVFAVLLTTLQDGFASYAGRVVHLLNNHAITGSEFEALYRRAVDSSGGAVAAVVRSRRVVRGERGEVSALLRRCEAVMTRAMPRTADAFVYTNVNDDAAAAAARRRGCGADDDDDDAPLPHTNSMTMLTTALDASRSGSAAAALLAATTTSTSSTSSAAMSGVEERVLAVNEARVIAMLRTLPLTREEWLRWLEHLSLLLLQESPFQVMRCTALPLGVLATPLAVREPSFALRVMPVAFRTLCAYASPTLRVASGECLRYIFRHAMTPTSTVPDEVLVVLLGMVEHMDRAGETLALSPQSISDCAWSRGMLAKALYWREAAYRVDPVATVESLMSLYSELHMVDAAVGILAQTTSEEQRRSLLNASLVKLARYDEALALTRQELAHERDDVAAHGDHASDDDADNGGTSGHVSDTDEHTPHTPPSQQQQPHASVTAAAATTASTVRRHTRLDSLGGPAAANGSLTHSVDGSVDGRWGCHVRLMLCLSELGEYAQVLDEWSQLHARFAATAHYGGGGSSSGGGYAPGAPLALLRTSRNSVTPGSAAAAAAACASVGVESDDGNLLHHVAHYAADAAMRMQAYDTLEQTLAWVPQHTLPHAMGEAVLCIADRDYDAAHVAVRAGQLLLLDELSGLLHESYNRAYDGLVAAQQLTELEEMVRARRVEAAFDTTAHFAAVSRMWEQRIRMMTPSVRVWKRVLATRSLLIAPPDDVKTRIRFVKLCRREGATQLQKFTLDELLGHHNNNSNNGSNAAVDGNNGSGGARGRQQQQQQQLLARQPQPQHDVTYDELTSRAINPRVALQYVKYLAASNGFGADTTFGLERDVVQTLINVHSRSDSGQTLARAYARLGAKSTAAEAVQCYYAATLHDPLWNVAWRLWAEANVDVLATQGYSHEACLNAIRGYIHSIQLGTSHAGIIQDVLKLLTLWSRHGDTERGLRALRAHVLELPARVWHLVVPQLIARLDSGSDESCHLVADVLRRVAYEYPHTLVYPLNLCTESESERRRSWASEVLGRLQARYPALVVQGRRMIRELVRIAALVHERWYDALESAASGFFARQSVRAMRRTLLPMHEALLREPETVLEAQFLFRYSARLNAAQEWLLSYTTTRNIADVHAAWQLYHDVYKSIDAEQKVASVLYMQYCSPALFEARDIALGIPDVRPAREASEAATAASASSATAAAAAAVTAAATAPETSVSRVAYFLDELHVIPSKQRPKRLGVVTREGRTQKFLLKGREDLRLDERVMQLFGLVNILMLSDTRSSKNAGFQIQRYSVTPLSDSAGLIGWVDGCDTLHELVKRHREYRGVPTELEMRMLNQIIALDHVKAYDCLTVMSKVEVMEFLAARTSGQDMRKAMWVMAPTCEVWLERRRLYATSLANMSMVGYILGLGDRHPNNMMLQRASGLVVHIDFGDCFEVAMTRDKFPEKVPFRLTRMLANALDVSGVHGAFRATCETSMRVLRENSHSVLALLEAFLQDPLISWRLVNRPGQEPESLSNHKAMEEQVKAAVAATGVGGEHSRSQMQSSTVAMATAAAAAIAAAAAATAAPSVTGTTTSPSAMAHAGESYAGGSLVATDAVGRRDTGNSHSVVRHLFGEEVDVVHQGVLILKRLSSKLDGMDFLSPTGAQSLDAPTQVRRLIDEATDQVNIAQSWSGWYPFW